MPRLQQEKKMVLPLELGQQDGWVEEGEKCRKSREPPDTAAPDEFCLHE